MLSPRASARTLALGLPVALLLGASRALPAQEEAVYRDQRQRLIATRVSAMFETWVATSGVPGAVLALVEGDQTLLLAGFGLADTQGGKPIDPHSTRFRVDGLMQSLTAAAVLQLVDRGRLRLDAEIPDLAERSLSTIRHEPVPTLRDLLLHTSGLDTRLALTRARAPAEILPLDLYVARRLPRRVRSPGKIAVPSSHGYALAGVLIERASGQRFSDYLRKQILTPLQMSGSSLAPDHGLEGVLATGHRHSDGMLRPVVDVDYPQALPAFFLLTTGIDMTRWLKALVGRGRHRGIEILSSESTALLLDRQFTLAPSLPGRTLAFREGRLYSPAELYLASKGNGFSSILMLLPDARVGLFAAFNCEVDFWPPVYAALEHLVARSATAPKTQKHGTGAGRDWSRYTGYWRDSTTSLGTPEKLVSLIRQNRLTLDTEGALHWLGRSFEPDGDHALQARNGSLRLHLIDSSPRLRLVTSDGAQWERLHWFETRPVQSALWVLFSMIFMAACWQRSDFPSGSNRVGATAGVSPRWAVLAVTTAVTLHFGFLVSLVVFVAATLRSPAPTLLYDIPLFARVALVLPILAGASTVVAIPGLVLSWRSPLWRPKRRRLTTALTFFLLGFLAFLRSWNLLGFHL